MGPQFAHLQAFSIKPNKSGNSIEQVLGEVMREIEFSQHITDAKTPTLIYGVGVPELKILHDEMLEKRKTSVTVKGKKLKRAIRKDRNTLMTAVSSFPILVADLDKDETGETRRRYEKWKKLNIDYLKQLYGDQLKTIIEHTDEEYPHIHAYILPDQDPDAKAVNLHPGEIAKAEAAELAKQNGVDSKLINTVANTAYKAVMRKWQDDFYEFVGAPCGLTRDGPKRARETRAQWKSRKATADITAKVIEKNEADKKENEAAARQILAETRSVRSHSDVLDKAEEGIEAERAELVAGRMALESDRRNFEQEQSRFRAKVGKVRAALNLVLDVMSEKLGVARDGKLGDVLNRFLKAADDIEPVPQSEGDSLSM